MTHPLHPGTAVPAVRTVSPVHSIRVRPEGPFRCCREGPYIVKEHAANTCQECFKETSPLKTLLTLFAFLSNPFPSSFRSTDHAVLPAVPSILLKEMGTNAPSINKHGIPIQGSRCRDLLGPEFLQASIGKSH